MSAETYLSWTSCLSSEIQKVFLKQKNIEAINERKLTPNVI